MLAASTLGKLQFSSNGVRLRSPGDREAALLAYVAYEWPRPTPRRQLAQVFWPESSERHGLHSVSQALYRLASSLPGLSFVIQGHEVAVPPENLQLDVRDFRRLVREGDYAAAATLYHGPFLEGLSLTDAPDFEEWLESVRTQVSRLAEEALRRVLTAAEDRGDGAAVEAAAAELLRLNPLDQAAAASDIGVALARGAVGEGARRYGRFLQDLQDAGVAPVQRVLDLGARLDADGQRRDEETHWTLPLVGRSREFDALKRSLSSAQQGQGQTVLVLGRAGVGKTRLCEQLLRLAAIRGFRTLRTSCSPLLSGTPYAAVRELLSSITATDLQVLQPGAVSTLAHVLPQGLASIEGQSPGDLQPREWLYEAVAALLTRTAERLPLLVLFEDVHWLDEPTGDLLRFLSHTLKKGRVLLVATARTEELPKAFAWIRADVPGPTGAIELQELRGADVDDLIAAFGKAALKPVPADIAADVRRRAGGHPFFTLELLKSWTAADSESPCNGSLPTSIEQFLSTRFATLSSQALRCAEALAVVGGTAEDVVLAGVAGLPAEHLPDAIEELGAEGFTRDADGRTAFVHDLVREVAYRQMSAARRRLLHARAVRALRGSSGVDVGVLAVHSARALDHVSACRFAMVAAERANRRFGHTAAEPFWRMASEHARTARVRLRSRYQLAHCLSHSNKDAEAERLFSELTNDPGLTPVLRLAVKAEALAVGSRLNRALDVDRSILELVGAAALLQPSKELLAAVTSLLFVLALGSRRDLTERCLPTLAKIVEGADNGPDKARCLTHLAIISLSGKDWKQVDYYTDRMREVTRQLGPYWEARVEAIGAIRALFSGDLRRADAGFSAAYQLVETAGHGLNPAELGNWAVVKLEMGEFAASESLLKSGIDWARPRETGYMWALAESNFALLELERGNMEQAIAHAQTASEVGGAAAPPASSALALAVLGITADPDAAVAAQCRTMLLDLLGSHSAFGMDTSYAEIFLARMSEREGKVEEALERLEKAIEWYAGRDFFCHGRLVLEKARLIGTRDPQAGLTLAREVRARAVEAEGVLLLNKAEALIRDLKRAEPARTNCSLGPALHSPRRPSRR